MCTALPVIPAIHNPMKRRGLVRVEVQVPKTDATLPALTRAAGMELLARVPNRMVKILPPAATPFSERIEPINDLDTIDILGVLVTDL
jgi:hypothetical protein